MEGQAVTTNPWLIMAINMTVVFAVLILLGVLMQIVHMIDPTKKKKQYITNIMDLIAVSRLSRQ